MVSYTRSILNAIRCNTSDTSWIHITCDVHHIKSPRKVQIRGILDVLRREGLPMHVHSVRLTITHLECWWSSSSNGGTVTENSIVMVSLVYTLVSLPIRLIDSAIITAPLSIASLGWNVIILASDRRARSLSFIGYELPSES